MIDISLFEKCKGTRLIIPDTSYISGEDVKELRERFGMSQNAMAEALGVSKRCIKYWESGRTISSPAQKLIYLLTKFPYLMSDLYRIVNERKQ